VLTRALKPFWPGTQMSQISGQFPGREKD